ncbi:hypothetical protein BS47DRAFT_1356080 [Hydnum rufescens UP504]|uniref:NmrA-like domain-containing protein n=1 Tax=Hydnum rufescens UP504 TaxID=1448309 RepID=A0A9P6AES7_9AGAM|nr:hypothetical protein BS47DRAFT_1356080 [Hydnum rufescens UP504]
MYHPCESEVDDHHKACRERSIVSMCYGMEWEFPSIQFRFSHSCLIINSIISCLGPHSPPSFLMCPGLPVIKALLEKAEDGTPSPYAIHALTRNPKNPRAKEVEQQGVELIKGVYGMFVNTDFFTVGDEGEMYGGIQLFELAKYAGVQHFIWSNLDYGSRACGERMDSWTTKLSFIVSRKAIGKRNMPATITTPKVALEIT